MTMWPQSSLKVMFNSLILESIEFWKKKNGLALNRNNSLSLLQAPLKKECLVKYVKCMVND